MYVYPDVPPANIIILVKLEFTPMTCAALRFLVRQLFYSSRDKVTEETEADEAMETFSRLMSFINGPEFQETVVCVDTAIQKTGETREFLNKLLNYTTNQIRQSIGSLNIIETELNHAKDKLEKGLRNILNGNFQNSP